MALPLTLVIVAAEIDLSVASLFSALSSALMALPVEPQPADRDDHPDLLILCPARYAARSTACW